MAKKWREVASSGAFLALSMEEREEARRQYFESVVAPQVGAEDLEDARRQFFSTTSVGEPEAAAPVAKDEPQPGFFERAQNAARDFVGSAKSGLERAGEAVEGTFRETVGFRQRQPRDGKSVLEGAAPPVDGRLDEGALRFMSMSPERQAQEAERVMPKPRAPEATMSASPEPTALQRLVDRTVAKPLDNSLGGLALETAGDVLRGGARGVSGILQSAYGGIEAAGDAAGIDALSSFGAERAGNQRGWASRLGNPVDTNPVFQTAAEGLVSSAPAFAMGPVGGAAYIVGQSGLREYSEVRAAGGSEEEAASRGVVMGLTEMLGEVMPIASVKRLFKVAGSGGSAKQVAAGVADLLIKDQLGEQATYAMQSMYEKAGLHGRRPDMTLAEYVEGAIQTAQVSLASSALAGGGAGVVRAAAKKPEPPEPGLPEYQQLVDQTFGAPPAAAPVRVEQQRTTVITPEEILSAPLPQRDQAGAPPAAGPGVTRATPAAPNQAAAPAAGPIDLNDPNSVLSTVFGGGAAPGVRPGPTGGVADAGGVPGAAGVLPGGVEIRGSSGGAADSTGGANSVGLGGGAAPVQAGVPAVGSTNAQQPLPQTGRANVYDAQAGGGGQAVPGGPADTVARIQSEWNAAVERATSVGRAADVAGVPRDLRPASDPQLVEPLREVAAAISEATGFADTTGERVVFVESDQMADGLNYQGRAVVNVKGMQKPALFIAGHEISHTWQNLAERGAVKAKLGQALTQDEADAQRIWAPVESAIWDMIPDSSREAYAYAALSDEVKGRKWADLQADPKFMRTLRREMAADFHGKRLSDPKTVNELARRAPEHFGEYAKKVVGWINSAITKLRGSKGGNLGANDVDRHIKDLAKAKLIWTDAMISWRKRGGASAAPVAQAAGQPSASARITPQRRAKIDEAVGYAREHVPEYAYKDAAAIVEQYKGAPEMAVPDTDRARLEASIAPLIDRAKALQPGFKAQVEALAGRLGGEPKVPGVKALKRAAEKMFQEEAEQGRPFEAGWLKDLVRGTIVVRSMDEVPQAIEAVQEAFNVTRVKDRFSKPTEAGYRDVLLNVDLGGMPAELQIHIPQMLAAKELGHLMYEVERSLPDGDEKRRLQEAQAKFYGAAFDAATGAEPSLSRRATSSKNSSRDTDSSSSSLAMTTPVTADLGDSPGSRTTGSSSLAKNLVPSGNDDKSITGTPNSDTPSDPSIVNLGEQPSEAPQQFDIKTLREGSLKVMGDIDAIRAALPDDVKGRKVPGGMLFSPSAAPRAKAALEGRKLAYSRAGQVIDKLPIKDGKYVGAPEKFNTPQKIPQLRKILRQLAEEGAPGRFWYENSSKEVLQMVGGDVKEARKFVALLAIYSPQAKVDTNSTFALRAWAQHKAGQPISVKTKVMDDKATAAMSDIDAFWSGEKTGNFFNNLLREIDPSVADKQGATIDMWMMRAAQYESDAPTSTQYAFMENENNRIARDLGWEPQQVQAAIWVAMKARTENKGVKKATEESSEKRGWIRWAESMKGAPVRVILNAQKHRDNWLAKAMAHDVTKSDTFAAKFDFSDGVRRHIGQISWEARPGRSTGVLPGVNDAPYDQQVEFQQAVQKALYSDEGADLLAQQLGLLVDGPDILAPGVWQGEVAAGMQKQVAMAPGKGDDGKSVDPAQKQALDLYAATLGLLLRQEGVGWHRPFYKGLKSAENGVELRIGRPMTKEEAQSLWAAVDERMRAAGVADWEQGAGMISSPNGMRLVNFGAVDNNAKFRDLIQDAAATLAVEEVDPVFFSSDGNLVTNDWKEADRGQGFARTIRDAGRSDLLGWAASVLAPRVQAVFDEFSGKYGWGNPGRVEDLFDEPSLSRRSDAAGDRRDRGIPEGSEQGGPTYGVATPGAAAPVEAIHFSQQQRSSLSSAAYGSGLRGAEMERVMRSSDTRLRQRVCFYVNQGTGIRPESGVGTHAHSVTLANLYDTAKGEIKGAGNDFESAVLDAGYDGYLVRLPGSQSGQAVLLGAHNVPVQYLGLGAPEKTQPAPASQAAAASSTRSGDDLVSRKALDVAAIRGLATVQAVAPSFRFEFGKARVKAEEAELANAALEQLGSELSFSRRGALVSPQSTLDAAIQESTRVLENAIQRGGQMAGLGRTPHVLGMLKGVAVPLTMDGAVVRKVFIEKHAGKLEGIPAGDIVRGLYRPAMVFQQKSKPNEYELVLPVVTQQGPLTAAILVDGDRAAVKSIYPRSWNKPESGPGLRKWMADQADSKPVYADEYLAAIAVTGNEDARAQAGIREKAGSPGDQRPGVADLGASARQTSPAQTPAGSGSASVARPGAPVNEHFIGWRDYRALAAKFGRLPNETDLLRWIGDNYQGDPADAPSFSARRGDARFPMTNGGHEVRVGASTISYEVNGRKIGVVDLVTDDGLRGRGSARAAMQSFLASADRAGKGVELLAFGQDDGVDDLRLEGFYRGLGFASVRRDPYGGMLMWRSPVNVESAIGNDGSFDADDANISSSARQPTLWRDELGRLRMPTGKLAAYYGGILNTWLAKVGMNYMSPELKRQFREMKLQLQKAQDVTVAVAKQSFKMSEAERELVSDIIEGELKTGVVPPSHAVQMAMGMQAVLGQQTDELVALGMLSKDSADLWRGKYLPRFYKPKLKDQMTEWGKALQQLIGRKPIMAGVQGKRLKSRGLWETVAHKSLPEWEALGWQVRDPDYDPATATARTEVQIWRDFTREERDKMGEIRDAGFRFVMGYQQAQRDIAYGKLFKGIADNIASKKEKPGFVQVPDGTVEGTGVKRYGALAGMWVPLEVLQHLKAMDSGAGPAMQMYRKAMSLWKEGKVVLNPVSHANNVLSNITMAHFAGVSYWDVHKYAGAARDLATGKGLYQEAKDAGLMLGTMGQEELMQMLPPELQALVHQQKSTGGKLVDGAFNVLTFSWTRKGEQKGLRKWAAKAYEAEDVFFRYMIYRDARARGLTPTEAVDHSQRYMFTYDDLPVGAQRIRDFGLPFFAYTYKVIPALLHTAANYPHRILAPAAVLYGLNAAMYALAAGDDDEDWLDKLKAAATDPERQAKMKALEEEERANLPPWMKGSVAIGAQKAIRLHTDDVLGLPVFWDVGQIMPGGNMFDTQNNAGGVALPQSLTVSHPLFTTMGAMLMNRDSFFGKDIVDKTDTGGEAAQKRAEWLWRQFSPAISFGNYHWERGLNILAQQTGEPVSYWPWRELTGVDKAGMPIEPGYTALQTVGIKVRPVDLDRSAEMRDGQNKALMRDIDRELRNFRRMNQAGYMSDANLERELERAQLKKERLREGLTIDGDER